MNVFIQTKNLSKVYRKSSEEICAIDALNLQIDAGDFAVIYGHSGCGKSTLLLMLGGMLHPTSGQVIYNGQDLYAHTPFLRRQYRKESVGFVFQKFYLMPYLTVMDNIRLSLTIRNINHDVNETIQSITEQLGIHQRLHHLPVELSVGEQQRAAMARTLAGNPELILADEPTGNLDRENRTILAECLEKQNQEGKTVILATHDESLLELGNKKIQLVSGRVIHN